MKLIRGGYSVRSIGSNQWYTRGDVLNNNNSVDVDVDVISLTYSC